MAGPLRGFGHRHAALAGVVIAVGLIVIWLPGRVGEPRDPASTSSTTSAAPPTSVVAAPDVQAVPARYEDRPRGGSARVAVFSEPDPAAPTLGGDAVRSLVLPRLFAPGADGRWTTSLVVPRTDVTAPDRRSARFKLIPGATWSDGAAITIEDLRASADARFVAGLEGPASDGTITVRFTQALPGWRRLWSGSDGIPQPRPEAWGGPFVVESRTPGLETVLRRNDRWYGRELAHLDELRLVLVPDATTQRKLLERGRVDVIAPMPYAQRTALLESVKGATVTRGAPGGWWLAMLPNPAKLDAPARNALVRSVDRARFASAVLKAEATLLQAVPGSAVFSEAIWSDIVLGQPSALKGKTIDLVSMYEEPMSGLVGRSVQRRVRNAGGALELRTAEAERVEGWIATGDYDVALMPMLDGLELCWTCRWATVDEALARSADAGEAGAVVSLERKLKDEGHVLPLWQHVPVVAVRDGLQGVAPNGFAASGAANAWEWWRG